MRGTTTTFAVLILAALPVAAADTGSGHFRMDKTRSTFASACAFRNFDPEKRGATRTSVVLASVPLDCAALDRGFDPVRAAEEQVAEAKGASASLHVAADGARIEGSWSSAEPYDSFGFGGQGEIALAENSETRIEGRYFTPQPDKFFDKTYEFDFKFACDVLAGSVTGKALPAGGGEAGKAFLAYVKAMNKKDRAAARKLVTAAQAEMSFDDADLFDLKLAFTLKEATVAGGLEKAGAASLDVDGKSQDGDKMRGRVTMVQEGGSWKLATEHYRMVFD